MKFEENNIAAMTDSYKLSHWKFLEPGTEIDQRYMEARTNAKFEYTTWFGLQYYIKKYLSGKVLTKDKIDQARILCEGHMPDGTFNNLGWYKMLEKYDGRLPLKIKALPEGTNKLKGNVLMVMENTDEEFPWLTGYIDTLLTKVWYPSTVATISNHVYNLMKYYANLTGTPELNKFSLHDFGYRGTSSEESAGIGGMSHLVNFVGSDNIKGLMFACNYYNADLEGTMSSIPATEHSVIIPGGRS